MANGAAGYDRILTGLWPTWTFWKPEVNGVLTRREFLRLCLQASAGLALSTTLLPVVAEAATRLGRRTPLVWLEACTCAGNIISFLNAVDPGLEDAITELFDFRFAPLLMAAEGERALDIADELATRRAGEYVLVVEGTIPAAPMAVLGARGDRQLSAGDLLDILARGARSVVAAGTCAAFGGIYAARPNPSGSRAIGQLLPGKVINVPGCPIHPDWLMGTLAHLLLFGEPELDSYRRPLLFFSRTIHDQCPRRGDFTRGNFATFPGDDGCFYRIGCKGPVTHADCPTRQWNHYRNWPIESNTPCIGCTSPQFPDGTGPFYQHLPDLYVAGRAVAPRTVSRVIVGGTAGATGLHLVTGLARGRLRPGRQQVGGEHDPEARN
jgi:hydrogenase small subunit